MPEQPPVPRETLAAKPDPSLLKKRLGKNALLVWTIEILIVLAVFVAPFAVGAFLGLLQLPGTNLVYRPRAPVRVVSVTRPLSMRDMIQLLEKRLADDALNNRSGVFHVQLSEGELSAALQGLAAGPLAQSGWTVRKLQIAAIPDEFEISGQLTKSLFRFDVILYAHLVQTEEGIRLLPTRVHLGRLTLSPERFRWLARKFAGYDPASWVFSFGDVRVQSTSISHGRVDLYFKANAS